MFFPYRFSNHLTPFFEKAFFSSIDAPQGRLVRNVFYILKIYIK